MGNIIGLDLSLTSTGACVMDMSDEENFVVYCIKPKKRGIERLLFLEEEILSLFKSFSNTWVFMEGYAYRAMGRQFDIGELGGVVKRALHKRLSPNKLIVVPPSNLKQFITKKGNAKKEIMREWVYRKYDVGSEKLKTNDEVDAFALCKFGLSWLRLREGDETGLTAIEKKALTKV